MDRDRYNDNDPNNEQYSDQNSDQGSSDQDSSDTEDEIIDVNWIKDFENEERYYTMFYPEKARSIKVDFLYVNKHKEIEKISEKVLFLRTENKITKEELIQLVKENERLDKIKYKLVSVLIYNITLKHDELRNFLHGSDKYDFMTSLKNIDDYDLQSSVNCLQSVNNMYIIYTEEDHNDGKPKMANTKRVRFNIVDKKTRRRK
jgi:hypothetical protein